MKNFTRILITASLVTMVSSITYAQDVFKSANVGIGTVTPQQKLDVAGNIKFSGALMPGTPVGLPGSTGNILLSQGANTAPIWLSNGTSGTILVANSAGIPTWSSASSALLTTNNIVNGGANSAVVVTNGIGQVVGGSNVSLDIQGTLNGILYGQGTGSSAIFTSAGTSGQVLEASAIGVPTWTTPSLTAGWALAGNSIASTASFLGTTDGQPLTFRVNNVQAGRLDVGSSVGNAYFGYGTGGSTGDQGIYQLGLGLYALGNQNSTGGANVGIGAYAFSSAPQGDWDVSIGAYSQYSASFPNTNQGYNVAVGAYSMYSNSVGANASVIGSFNTAVGFQSMFGSGTTSAGNYNVALGTYSLYNISTGGSNTALGTNALYNTTASRNVGVGDSSLYSNTTGSYNTGLGYQSNVGGNALSNATAIGYQATAPVSNSIALGNAAATSLYLPGYTSAGALLYTSASNGLVAPVTPGAAGTILESNGTSAPTWISVAGVNSVTGTPPIYITNPGTSPVVNIEGLPNNSDIWGVLYSAGSGTSALFTPSPSAAGLVLQSNGTSAPTWVNAGATNAWGLAGNSIAATSFLGTTDAEPLVFKVNNAQAGRIDIPYQNNGIGNTYLGSWGVLGSTTYGSPGGSTGDAGTVNVAIGVSALGGYNIGGSSGNGAAACCGAMVAVGAFAYPGASGGEHSVAIGAYSQLDAAFAGAANSNGYTVSVGAYTLYSNTLGNYETAIGYQSMYGNGTGSVYGNDNTALGTYSLYGITTGGSNTALGSSALYNTSAGRNTGVGDSSLYSNTTGEYNTGLGYQSNVLTGNLTNATAIGYQAVAGESNSLVLGNGSAFVGINTSTPQQLLEVGGTANTVRVDALKSGGTYNNTITANAGNIVYSNNANGDLYSLPNGSTGTVLTLNASGVPSWASPNAALTTYNITGNTGTAVVISGGNLNSVVGSGNVTLDVQSTTPEQGGVFYGTGAGTAATFNTTGSAGQVLISGGAGAPTWGSVSSALTTNSIVNGGGSSSVVVGNGANQVVGATNVSVDVQGTLNGILYGQGTNSAIFTSAGASGQVLAANASGVPTWTTLTAPTAWSLTGNTTGPTFGTDFIGFTSTVPVASSEIEFVTNGQYAGVIDMTRSNIEFGRGAGGDSTAASYSAKAVTELEAIGAGAAESVTSGNPAMVAIGYDALHNFTVGTGEGNTLGNNAVGAQALYNLTTGIPNNALGTDAGFNITTGAYNASVGFVSNYNQTTGSYNVAAGDSALYGGGGNGGTPATYVASYNTAVGVGSLAGIGTGVANGTGGFYNTAIGVDAAEHTSTGNGNVAVGFQAGNANTTGYYNTVMGYQANVSSGALTNATAIGYLAIAPVSNSITLGNSSVTSLYLPGYSSVGDLLFTSAGSGLVGALTPGTAGTVLASNGTSSAPTWVSVTGVNNVSGTPPIYSTGGVSPVISIQGLPNNSDLWGVLYSAGSGNSALFTPSPSAAGLVLQSNGTSAPTWGSLSASNAWSLVGNSGTVPGTNYLGTLDDNSLEFEVNGHNAGSLDPLNTGYSAANVYLGSYGVLGSTTYGGAGNNDAGNGNVGLGLSALGRVGGPQYVGGNTGTTTGYNASQVAVGVFSLASDVYGEDDIAIGAYSQFNENWASEVNGFNTSVGTYSLYSNSTGQYNTALGYYSMYGNGSPTAYGNFNTALGYNSLYSPGNSASNTAVGSNALYNTTASRNTAVGDSALASNTTGANNTALGYQANVSIGNLSNATVIGYGASALAGNSITLGNSAVTGLYLPGYANTGSILYTSNVNGLVSSLTPGTAGYVLESQGTASVPTWVSIAGANSLTGIAPVYITGTATAPDVNVQGLPNNSDMGGVLYSTGSGNAAVFTPTPSNANLVLTSSAAGAAPTWQSAAASASAWNITGNSGTVAGTNYLGTTDANALEFEVNGHNAGSIDPLGTGSYNAANVYLGSYGILGSHTYGSAGNNDAGEQNVGIGLSALGSIAGLQYVGSISNLSTNNTDVVDEVGVGVFALANDQFGEDNIALGAYSQFNENWAVNTNGFNTSVGTYSLYSNSIGQNNTALGYQSMYGSGTATALGNNNTAMGYQSLYAAPAGVASNTAIGSNSLYNVAASRNTAVGDSALYSTTGSNNTALGYQANASGALSNAIVIGYGASALASNSVTLGNSSVTSLYLPGYTNVGNILYTSTGAGLVAALTPGAAGTVLASGGTGAAPTWTSVSGVNNVIGIAPIYSTGGTTPNISIQGEASGLDAGGVLYSTGSGNSAVFNTTGSSGYVLTSNGTGAPTWQVAAASTTAWNLTGNANATTTSILGTTDASSLRFEVNNANAGSIDPLNTGYTDANVYLGSYGVLGTTTFGSAGNSDGGGQNVGIGISALGSAGGINVNTINTANVAVGAFALPSAVYGVGLVAVGAYSQRYANWTSLLGYDVAVGSYSMYSNTTGQDNTALGYQSMFGSGSPTAYGNYNTALGYNSFFNSAGGGGGSNTALGSYSLYNSAGGRNTAVGDSALVSNTNGEYNTALGYQANVSSGSLTNATAIGYGATAGASNTLILGNGAAFVGINTGTPAQLLEIGGTANTIRVDGLKTVGSYYGTISANAGNIVYSNNANGDLYSLPNGSTGTVLTLNASGVPTWSTIGSSSFTTYNITGNTGTSVVVAGGNLNSVVGSGNVTLDVQGTAGGVFYGTGASPAAFTSAGTTGQVLSSNGAGAPTWATLSVPNAWNINGNAGTTPGTNFVGTTGASNLMFKVNGVVAGSLDQGGNSNAYYGYGVGLNGATTGNGGSGDYGSQNVAVGTEAMGNIPASTSVNGSEAIGAYSMYDASAATYNSAIGVYSQYYNAADYNVSVGAYTLYSNSGSGASTGFGEVALGHMSMYGTGTNETMGNYNTAIGYYSLYSITSGGSNTAVGSNALYTSTGGRNSAVGDSALVANTIGEYNTAVGYQAGITNTVGAENTLLGYNANVSANNLTNATALGYNASALVSNSVTLGNTAVTSLYLPGYSAVGDLLYTSVNNGLVASLTPGAAGTILSSNGAGNAPTWTSVAGINSVTGTAPIYVNNSSPANPIVYIQGLPNNSDAGGVLYSLGSGTSALFTPTPSASGLVLTSAASGGAPTWQTPAAASAAWLLTGNTGTTPGTNFVGTTGTTNLMFKVDGVVAGSLDWQAGNFNAYYGFGVGVNGAVTGNGGSGDYGYENTAVGSEAMGNITTNGGSGASVQMSEAIGAYAMYDATAANLNAAVGVYSQFYNSGIDNVSVGAYSLYSNGTGTNNVALGHYSMFGTGSLENMGSYNTAIGYYSLYNSTTGGSNAAIGSWSLYSSSGGRNSAVGDSALVANTTGEYNTAVGYQAGITNTLGAQNTLLGYNANVSLNNLSNATALGYNASAPVSNSVTLGNTAVTSLYLPGYTAVGDLLYTSVNTGLVSSLTPGAAGTVLVSNGSGNVPTWTSVAGVNSVTGTAPVYITNAGPNPDVNIQGLPNNSDAGGVLYSTGSASSAVFTATPSAGYILTSAAVVGGAPTWQNPASVSGSWTLSGNSNATATSILGTTTTQPLVFEVNSVPAGRLDYNSNENAYYGYGAGSSTGDIGGAALSNVGVGLYALGNATGAITSTEAIGAYSLYSAVAVYDDVAMGAYSQFDAASADNIAVGAYSLYSDGGPGTGSTLTTGYGEVALGHMSMFGTGTKETMGNFNTAIGYYSLYSGTSTLSGGSNTAVGSNALYSTTAGRNTGVGDSALVANTAGEFNTAVGYQALTTALTSGANYNTALGYLANVSSTTASNATAIGANALASANNTLILGAINGVNSATISATGNPGITNVGIGTNAPDVDAALAIKTGHLETQVTTLGANSGVTTPTATGINVTTIPITGTDVGGVATFSLTGAGSVGTQVQVTFANNYNSAPTVVITPANAATAAIMGTYYPYVTVPASSPYNNFVINFAVAPPSAGGPYSFNYFVIETQ